jgi:hypothetical protein
MTMHSTRQTTCRRTLTPLAAVGACGVTRGEPVMHAGLLVAPTVTAAACCAAP